MSSDNNIIKPDVSWKEITPGGAIYSAGNSEYFRTGDWSSLKPKLDPGKCRSCYLCIPVCPDSVITADGDKLQFNFNLCKGCGICVQACSFSALKMEKEGN